jgi:hypothetical protein
MEADKKRRESCRLVNNNNKDCCNKAHKALFLLNGRPENHYQGGGEKTGCALFFGKTLEAAKERGR